MKITRATKKSGGQMLLRCPCLQGKWGLHGWTFLGTHIKTSKLFEDLTSQETIYVFSVTCVLCGKTTNVGQSEEDLDSFLDLILPYCRVDPLEIATPKT